MVRIVDPGYEIWTPLDGDYILKFIEKCAETVIKRKAPLLETAPQNGQKTD